VLTPTGRIDYFAAGNTNVGFTPIPVIDIQNDSLRDAFARISKLSVVARNNVIEITPARTVLLVQERKLTFTEGSLFSGGGFLSLAAQQLGFQPQFAVECEPDYAEVYEANHPAAKMFNCSVEEVPWEALRVYRPLGLLTMGIPCEPYSRSRHWDKGTDEDGNQIRRDRSLPPEAHPNGDMVYWALRAVEATNAHTVLIENVPDFLKASSYFILKTALERLGYRVEGRVIDPLDYGELASRKRAVIVARTGSAPVAWPAPIIFNTRTMGEILAPVDSPECEWFDRDSKPWLYRHWETQAAKGNGFVSQRITADSSSVGAITKRYFAGQGQHPVVQHPNKPGTYRWLSLREVKELHGIPANYYTGESKTLSGELIGQGVIVSTMRRIIEANALS
jgi:DNA (cytosine-5)-methyltransferase 1